MARSFRSPRQMVREIFYGPEPVGAAGAAMLARYSHGQLDGGPLDGTPHFGMKGEANMTWAGLTVSPQSFQGSAQLGSIPNPPVLEYPALPNSTAPYALPAAIDWDALEGIVPT
jgi:hypothetical protein